MMTASLISTRVPARIPIALLALTAGAFGIGVTEFVIMGLLIEVGGDLGVSTSAAGLLISGYALGVVAGAPILLLFGGGLVLGNLAGGRVADRAMMPAVFGSLALLALVLALMGPLLSSRTGALVAVAALGFAAFATVVPLQLWVMSNAKGAGESLASSFNIAAFNMGNAIGAWAGGVALDRLGLGAVTWAALAFPIAALVTAVAAHRKEPS